MRALTIWPEWLWCIHHLGKRVENRRWAPPKNFIGERIALHAGAHVGGRPGKASMQSGLWDVGSMAARNGWSWMIGNELDYMSFTPSNPGFAPIDMYLLDDDQELSHSCKRLIRGAIVGTAVIEKVDGGDRPPWGVPGMAHWHLSDLLMFQDPIPARGKQRLWILDGAQEFDIRVHSERVKWERTQG